MSEPTIITCYEPIDGKRYLDEVQDEAYRASSLHGDAAVEAEMRIPYREVASEVVQSQPRTASMGSEASDVLCLSGAWQMKGTEPTDPGDPAPATGWFGRKAKVSPGMEERWYGFGHDRSGWDEVQVPTTVQKALIALGKLEDPMWNTNTMDELEEHGEPKERPLWFRRTRVERQDWWFARTFEVSDTWKGRRLTLRFDGIDYSGTVFVNGISLGHHRGMFGGPDHDVSGLIRFDGPNELVVRIDAAPESWNGYLKGSPGFGWHYGHLISLGIWQDVWLTAEPDVAVVDPYVTTRTLTSEAAELVIDYAVNSCLGEHVSLEIQGEISRVAADGKRAPDSTGSLCFRQEVAVSYGRSRYRTAVTLPDPALWWPIGYGDPSLYELHLTARVLEASSSQAEGLQSSDDRSQAVGTRTRFGVRTLEMRPLPDTPEETDYRWQFVINGVPMFIKGANWCWTEPMLERDDAKLERMLELARRAHVQMLRAWGGGMIETDSFYRTCDEKGILVYQEFPLCWGPMDAPHTDLGVLDRQVARNVKRLRNHPSLVMWGGGNENGPHGGADEGLFLVGRRCRGLDPSRPYHRTDPWGGSLHNWDVYHGGEPMKASTLANPSVFYGEYGIPSMTNRSSAAHYLPEDALASWPPTEESRGWLAHSHQFSLKDPIKSMRYGAYFPIRSWDDYILSSQTAQGDQIRFVADVQRAGAGRSTAGFWYYKFSDLFPGHSWAVVDYYGSPKLSYYRALQACRPRLAFATFEKSDGWCSGDIFGANLYAGNDTLEPLADALVTAIVYGSDWQVLWMMQYDRVTLVPGVTKELDTLSLTLPQETDIRPFLLVISLQDRDGDLISDQWYAFNGQAKSPELLEFEQAHRKENNEYPGELAGEAFRRYAEITDAPLRRLPQTTISIQVKSDEGGGTIVVRNTGEVPAYRVTLEGVGDDAHSYLSDNDFGLVPGQERVLHYEVTDGNALQTDLTVRAWNAEPVRMEEEL
ncbi:glycoside hydrolase family 2 protein [Paenibacillus daejeonensis]|uniref:glycoside hydrolase family 2 protein n=1 Tax=Paenibacillus daejeonensis TaxID=135193 RepID=UPI00036AC657|nr:glycoside hydrolase family 2 [Paenibacillus daejeonensis]